MITNVILKYVRERGRLLPDGSREKGAPKGVVLAGKNPETKEIHLGWSLAHTHKFSLMHMDVIPLDRFDKNLGIEVAKVRAENGSKKPIPASLLPEYREMAYRAVRYFKDAKLAEYVQNNLSFS